MLKALVFDFDGLIIDTETVEFQVWQEIYRELGQELSLETWECCIGTSADAFNPYTHLEQLIGHGVDQQQLHTRRTQRQAQLVANLPILPGVADYLQEAKRMGLKVGIASSSTHAWVEGYLEERGLLSYFAAIRCSDDVEHVKPDPALYSAAVAALGVQPNEAVAFEDSLHGLRAAKAAGLHCVAVPNSVTRHMPLDQADAVLTSMADMPLPQLLAKLAAAS